MKTLKNWWVVFNGVKDVDHLVGNVYNHERIEDGHFVVTSGILSVIDKGDYKEVCTQSGSIYKIYKEDMIKKNNGINYYEFLK